MISKRKRAARHREASAEELLRMYRDEQAAPRDGAHVLLRWLTIANTFEPLPAPPPPCPMDAANAAPFVPTLDDVEDMEQAVATRVFASEQPEWYVCYAAHFFQWWSTIAHVAGTEQVRPNAVGCAWLTEQDIEKSLVVPDVRRGAIKIAQRLEVRAGEPHVSAHYYSGSKSCNAVLQSLRTGEWNNRTHSKLMYGTVTEIYNAGLIAHVYFTIVHGRYLGRLGFDWAAEVLTGPTGYQPRSECAWPRIYVHGGWFLVSWGTQHARCRSAPHAYSTWVQMCMQLGGVIGGRYDVRKCTI
jgi:hypothetical protein